MGLLHREKPDPRHEITSMDARVSQYADRWHPAVVFLFCAVCLAFSMAAMQPVYLALTFVGQTALSISLKGGAKALRGIFWQAPLVLILAIANPLFVSVGSTELFRIGLHAVYLEAVLYGFAQGLLLVNTLLAFSNAAQLLSSDKVLSLLGGALPTLSLMISMVMRLIPSFVRRGREIGDVRRACTAADSALTCARTALSSAPGRACAAADAREMPEPEAAAPSSGSLRGGSSRAERAGKFAPSRMKGRFSGALRTSTVLMGWGMEDSLETADAMRARGWNSGAKRTSYQRYRFRRRDALACALVAALALASAPSAAAACARFSFYPRIDGLAPWYSYAPYALLLALPLIAALARRPR